MNRDQKYLEKIKDVAFNPVFILGSHRSGTTLLYELLSGINDFDFVNAYHIIAYSEVLANHIEKKESQAIQSLEQQFISLGITDRVFDSIKVSPKLPEEYGFILNNAGYENFLSPENLDLFIEMCSKIQFIDPKKYFLLKNPWCFSHFLYIKSVIPNAKFIFIHRHPIHVINSKLKAVRKTLTEWNPYTALLSARYHSIFKNPLKRGFYRFVYSPYLNRGVIRTMNQAIESTQYYLKNISKLDQDDYVETSYEDLCNDPDQVIRLILDFLNLESNSQASYQDIVKPRPVKLLPEVSNCSSHVYEQLKNYFQSRNYSI